MLLGSGGDAGGQPLKCSACDLWSSSYDYWLTHLTSTTHQDKVGAPGGHNPFGHESWIQVADRCLQVTEVNGVNLESLVGYLAKFGTVLDLIKQQDEGSRMEFYFVKYDSSESVNKILMAQKTAPHKVQEKQIIFRRKYEESKDNGLGSSSFKSSNGGIVVGGVVQTRSGIGLLAAEYGDQDGGNALGDLQAAYDDEVEEEVVPQEASIAKQDGGIVQENHDLFSKKMIEHLAANLSELPVGDQLEAFCKNILLSEPYLEGRYNLIQELSTLIKIRYPKAALYPCGMDYIGIGNSDDPVTVYVDMFDNALSSQKQPWETNTPQQWAQLYQILKVEADNFRFCSELVKTADRISFQHIKSGVKVYLRLSGFAIVQESMLIKFLCTLDPRVRPLLALTRYWTSVNKIFNSFSIAQDNPGRFSLLLMAFHLSNRNVIPTLAKLQSEPCEKVVYEGIDLSFCSDKSKRAPPNKMLMEDKSIMTLSALSLLQDFFHRFGSASLKENAVSLWYGKFFKKEHFTHQNQHLLPDDFATKLLIGPDGKIRQQRLNTGDAQHPFCVEDFFDLSINLGLDIDAAEVKKFQLIAWKTGEKLERLLNNAKPCIMNLFLTTAEDERIEKEQEIEKQKQFQEMHKQVQQEQQRLLQLKKEKVIEGIQRREGEAVALEQQRLKINEEVMRKNREEEERRRVLREEAQARRKNLEEEARQRRLQREEDDRRRRAQREKDEERQRLIQSEQEEQRRFVQRQQEEQRLQKQRELERNLERQREVERQQNLARQQELERQREVERQQNLAHQQELERQRNLARQKELEQQNQKKRLEEEQNRLERLRQQEQWNASRARQSHAPNLIKGYNRAPFGNPNYLPVGNRSNISTNKGSSTGYRCDDEDYPKTPPDQVRRDPARSASGSTSLNASKNMDQDDWLNTEWEEFSKSLEQPTSTPPSSFLFQKKPIAPVAPSQKGAIFRNPIPQYSDNPSPVHPAQYPTRTQSFYDGPGAGVISPISGVTASKGPLLYQHGNFAYDDKDEDEDHSPSKKLRSSEFMESESSEDGSETSSEEEQDPNEEEDTLLPTQGCRLRNPYPLPKMTLSPSVKNLFVEGVGSKDFAYGIRGKLQTLFLQFMKEFNNRFWNKCFGFEIELDPTYQDTTPADYAKFGDRKSGKMADLLNSVPCFEENFTSTFFCQSAGKLPILLVHAQPNDLHSRKYIRNQSAPMLKVLMDEVSPQLIPSNQNLRFKVEVSIILDYSNLNKDCNPYVKIIFDKGLSTQNEMLALFRFFGKLYNKMATRFLSYCIKRWLASCLDFDIKATERKCILLKHQDMAAGKNLSRKEQNKLRKKQKKIMEVHHATSWSASTLPPRNVNVSDGSGITGRPQPLFPDNDIRYGMGRIGGAEPSGRFSNNPAPPRLPSQPNQHQQSQNRPMQMQSQPGQVPRGKFVPGRGKTFQVPPSWNRTITAKAPNPNPNDNMNNMMYRRF